MIVDVHTHLWDSPEQLGASAAEHLRLSSTEPWNRPDASTTAHDEAMAPVQHALIHGLVSEHLGASIGLEQVAGFVARHPDKYLGFAGIDPMSSDYLKQVDRALELGLVGVTISPSAQAFHPTHTAAMALYEKCAEVGMPVFAHPPTHLGPQTVMAFSDPTLFDEVLRTFPTLRLVIGQVGYPWVEQTLTLLTKHRNVFADLSDIVTRPWQLYNTLWLAHQHGAIGQLLLGSDFPFCTPEKAIVTIYSVNTLTHGTNLPNVPREQLRSIVERDALACLGLTPPNSTTGASPPKAARPLVAESTEG